jgi:hypothetical protein
VNVLINFVTPEVETEWNDRKLDPRVIAIVLYIARFVAREFNETLTVTDVWRSDARQIELYGGIMPAFGNVHGDWRAVDLRTRDFTPEQIRTVNAHIEQHWKRLDGKPVMLYHSVGSQGFHWHVQVPKTNSPF